MKDNHIYNLMTQLTQEQKSHWRIKKLYTKEATSKEAKALWATLAKDKEAHITALKALLKKELQ